MALPRSFSTGVRFSGAPNWTFRLNDPPGGLRLFSDSPTGKRPYITGDPYTLCQRYSAGGTTVLLFPLAFAGAQANVDTLGDLGTLPSDSRMPALHALGQDVPRGRLDTVGSWAACQGLIDSL
jgi:hypothetical protein